MSHLSDHHIAQLEPIGRSIVPAGEDYRLAVEIRTDLGAVGRPSWGERRSDRLNPLTWLHAGTLLWERWLSGLAVDGPAGSQAAALHREVSGLRDTTAFVVTDRSLRVARLVLASMGSEQVYQAAETVTEMPRSMVAGVRHAPHGVHRARFVLTFQDGSSGAFTCLFRAATRRLVTELAGPDVATA